MLRLLILIFPREQRRPIIKFVMPSEIKSKYLFSMPIPACIFFYYFNYPSIVFMHVFHMSMDVNLHRATQSIEHEKVINGLVACQKLCKIAAERVMTVQFSRFLIAIYLLAIFMDCGTINEFLRGCDVLWIWDDMLIN